MNRAFRWLFFLACICISKMALAQNDSDILNKTDENGLKQGNWKRYADADGTKYLAEEGRYLDGRKTGFWIEYYGNGKRKNSLEFKDGKPNGAAKMYHNNGNLSEMGTWKNGKWNGEYYFFYDCNGKSQHRFNFNENGKREGSQKYYYANGALFIEGTFKNGVEEGEVTIYNFMGKVVGRQIFEKGTETKESIQNRTFEYDQLKAQNDSLTKICESATTKSTLLSGYKYLYNKNRQVSKEGIFNDSRLIDGKVYTYDDNGLLIRIAIYKDGSFIEDEFNKNMSQEEKAQKELLEKLKNLDSEIMSMKEMVSEKEKEIEKKDNQLKERTLQNQVLEKEKQIKELLLLQQNNTLNANEAEALKKEYEIATLNKDRRIKEIEIKNQKTENDRKAQELKLNKEQKKFQAAEIKQHKFTRNLVTTGLVIVVLFSVLVFMSLQKNKKAHKIISLQKKEVERQKHLVEEKHREITDSINYAERIQRSFLATKEQLDENLKEYFVLFQPKDVVSGDFYWSHQLPNGRFILVTADSTGHGVPGSIMSLLNTSSLERAVELGITEPAEILNHTRKTIIERLKKDGSLKGGKDGMDCSLISFNKDKSKVVYSAANNPIWIIRNNEIIELPADKIPVGKHDRDTVSFTQHEINLQKGDMIYTLTDGFPDQFGGPKGKKFMYKKLKEVLLDISGFPLHEQNDFLKNSLKDWMGDTEQVDDITLIGIRV